MKLTAGTRAPLFKTEDVFGQPIDLAAYAGKPLLLSFFRNGACAVCNLQVHKLIQKYPTYHAQGLEILAVFESPRESILQYVGKQDAPFPIIADPQARLYDLYGVESSEAKVKGSLGDPVQDAVVAEAAQNGFNLTHEDGTNFFRLPADFLICPDGTIELAYYTELVGLHLPFAEIEAFLTQLAALR